MPGAIFAHPDLAPIYDVFDGDRDDLTAYLDITDELGADRPRSFRDHLHK